MLSGIDSMEAIEKLKNAPNKREFDSVKDAVQAYMNGIGMQTESAELERRAFYFPRGGIQPAQLNAVRIKNEYDVQHLLYAYLKPLYPAARAEVSEDTGYEAVRPDIRLDDDRVIEVKCSRSEMKEKKLIEEIEADMVHYRASHIYFFVYDKEKIIENPKIFKNTYENKIKEKQVCIIIHQPKRL